MNKLLIVDDSAGLLNSMKYILEHANYTVRTLLNADNIYEEIAQFQPDLLILDIQIPGEDGREICKKLKKSVQNKELLVLAFSASPTLLKDFKAYHADDFIEKPFELTAIIEKIESMLNRSSIRKRSFQFEPHRLPASRNEGTPGVIFNHF